jgi:hypothetical protein
MRCVKESDLSIDRSATSSAAKPMASRKLAVPLSAPVATTRPQMSAHAGNQHAAVPQTGRSSRNNGQELGDYWIGRRRASQL